MERPKYPSADLDRIFGPDLDPKPVPDERLTGSRVNDAIWRALRLGEVTESGEHVDPKTGLHVREIGAGAMATYAVYEPAVAGSGFKPPASVNDQTHSY